MEFTWDEEKNDWLKAERFVSFEEIANELLEGRYLDIVKNPARSNQRYFVLSLHEYTWLVPFVIDDERRIVMKTAFPSRKYHRRYGAT
jgi:uncharacterized DUF497 family protein